MLRKDKKLQMLTTKGISFKTATVIVIGIHLLAFFSLTQWSAYKTNVARQARLAETERRIEESNKQETRWPTSVTKLRVLATAPTPKPPIASSESTNQQSWWDKLAAFATNNLKRKELPPKMVAIQVKEPTPKQNEDIIKITEAARQALRMLDEKTKQLENVKSELAAAKKQQKAQVKITAPIQQKPTSEVIASQEIKVRNGLVISNQRTTKETRPATTNIVVAPDNVRTYQSNGFNYVNLDGLLSSHITID
jgi:hypothetical protein